MRTFSWVLACVLFGAALIFSSIAPTKAEGGAVVIAYFIAVFFVAVGVCIIYDLGNGILRIDLTDNEIYETVTKKELADGEWVAILKNRRGQIAGYRLEQEPPKIFKKLKGQDGVQSYPPDGSLV